MLALRPITSIIGPAMRWVLALAMCACPAVVSGQGEASTLRRPEAADNNDSPRGGGPDRLRDIDPGDLALVFERDDTRRSATSLSTPTYSPTELPTDSPTELPTNSPTELSGRESLAPPFARPVARSSAYPVPWVEATHLERSEVVPQYDPYDTPHFEYKLPPWDLFDGRLTYFEAPAWVDPEAAEPSRFRLSRPYETRLARRLKKLARKKLYQEVRRAVKRQWRSQFRESNHLRYDLYQERMVAISNIGKDPQDIDDLDFGYRTNDIKEDLFEDNYLDGEREIPLLTWGPLTITDSGSMHFNLAAMKGEGEESEPALEVGAKEKTERAPFLATKDYRIDTSFKVDLDPAKAFSNGNPMAAFDSYGFAIEVDILSDVLARDVISAEIEIEVDDHRDFAGFFNIVVKSRK